MKKFLLLYKVLFLSLPAFAQLNISPGTQWVNTGNLTINLSNLDMINNGNFSAGSSTIKCTGNTNNSIGGSSPNSFYQMEIAKSPNIKVVLLSQISVANQVYFTSGLLDLNQQNLVLAASATLNNEGENTRMIAPNGGEAIITVNLNAPNAVNAGNLGATISSTANLGTVTIKRGHIAQAGSGLSGSILRYYEITPQMNSSLSATMRFRYFDAEKNGRDENNFVLFQSDDGGSNWVNQSQTTRNTSSDFVEKSGLNSLFKFTLSDNAVIANCSATSVVLSVKAGKQNNVNVSWSTATETGNQGFAVERKLKGELNFTQLAFVNSNAAGGNSVSQLNYSYTDVNSSADTSYYRLKIVALNASTCYSDVKPFVAKSSGGKKGLNIINTDTIQTIAGTLNLSNKQTDMTAKLTVGPNPNNGNFWFTVNGIERETFATLYTMDGKILKQFRVTNLQQQQVSGLKSGIYILKVEGLKSFRVVVQTDGSASLNFPVINLSSIKN
jgi:type IX secretion system substrate protein